jgi:hypothetical protein
MNLQWWQCGSIGAGLFLLVTVIGMPVKIFLANEGKPFPWSEFPWFALMIAIMGFILGVVFWLCRILTRRLGRAGDALTGLLIGDTFFLICMWLFQRESLLRFDSDTRIMLAVGTVVGLVLGVWIGNDLRKSIGNESRGEDNSSSPSFNAGKPLKQ